jgi:glycosyltransferase involved in cell wall biosynthesis
LGTAGLGSGRRLVGWRPNASDPRVASVRIRCLNPVRELQGRGYPVEVFNPARSRAYSAVVYSKVYHDEALAQARSLKTNGTRIVLDLCDNHFYNPMGHEPLRTAGTQLRRMLAEADELVASTEAMAEVLREVAGPHKRVTVVGDAVEMRIVGVRVAPWERWLAIRRLHALATGLGREPGRTPLVWFGSHGGPSGDYGMGDLPLMRSLLESLHRENPLSLTVISNSAEKFERLIRPWSLPTYYLQWSAETFLDALRLHAIAVIPIQQNPFTRCKTNNRLATALVAGLAVVASRIPSYESFEACSVLDDWSEGLQRYISDPGARRRAVAVGQALVERDWSAAVIADQWQRYFDELLERGIRR